MNKSKHLSKLWPEYFSEPNKPTMTIEKILSDNDIGLGSLYYERCKLSMEQFAKIKWKEAQQDAAKYNATKKDKNTGKYPVASFTPYKK